MRARVCLEQFQHYLQHVYEPNVSENLNVLYFSISDFELKSKRKIIDFTKLYCQNKRTKCIAYEFSQSQH